MNFLHRAVDEHAINLERNKIFVGVEAQNFYRAFQIEIDSPVKFSRAVDVDNFFRGQKIFVVFHDKNFCVEHGIFFRKIEHVEGAAVAKKSFFVVAVKIFYLRGVVGIAQQNFQKLQARQTERGRGNAFALQIKFCQGEASINFSVDQKFFRFGEDLQKKFVVREKLDDFLRHEKMFQLAANNFIERRRRKIFLTQTTQTKFRQAFGQNKNFLAEAKPNPHQIIGQLPKSVRLKQIVFRVDFAAEHGRRMTQAIRVVKKIIQPLGARTIRLLKNFFVKVVVVRLVRISALVDELNPREARRKIFVRVEEGNLLLQFVGRPQVVGVVHGDIFSARKFHGLGNGDARPAIFLVKKIFYARVVKIFYNVAAVVLRAVVDD